jgi:anti-sigma B factor antagonist
MTMADVAINQFGQTARSDAIVTIIEDPWRAVVALYGELDMADAPQLRAELDAHIDAGRRVLRLDTTQVTFLDSSVLGVIVMAHRRCLELNGSLILTGVKGVVDRVVKLTGLDQVLLIDMASAPTA